MQLDATLPPEPLANIPAIAKAAEETGFGALWCPETSHDPFMAAALIAEHTHQLKIGTAVAIAFARSPATLAYKAWDLAQLSKGRFILGLGTQVKAHIERRFGMSWPDSVVGKLRDEIGAIRAIWDTWQNNKPLRYKSEYYKLTLMSPFFNPGAINYPDIPIYIAGVNIGLAKLAGEIADGFHVHPFHTIKYLNQVIIPAITEGAVKAGRTREEITLVTSAFVVTSPEEDFFVRAQIAFYASTPSYRKVMELHGWGAVAEELSSLASHQQWSDMPGLITDEMLAEFAIVCDVHNLNPRLKERYQGLIDRLGLYLPYKPGERDALWQALLQSA